MSPRNDCVDCHGNGKCAVCFGTGTNVHVNEDEPKCRNCAGTGTCPTCQGSGRAYVLPSEIQDLGLNKL
jgi:hypothetical protein